MKLFSSLLLIALLSSCATGNKLSSKAKDVDIMHGKAPSHCSALGSVIGTDDEGIEELAKNMARNKVAKMDGNALLIKEIVPNGKKIVLHGIAYKCD